MISSCDNAQRQALRFNFAQVIFNIIIWAGSLCLAQLVNQIHVDCAHAIKIKAKFGTNVEGESFDQYITDVWQSVAGGLQI